ncbi:hypothetical protein B0T09DRAFT_181029 [Sordaria sp. MPI-SDFR-AT-0083]|nr:hypothetical protein B0T09DRAFT_181029 [Sordaria sp. MPI-SDFR-AT-0083]
MSGDSEKPSQSSHTPFLWDLLLKNPQPLFRPKSRGWISGHPLGFWILSAFLFLLFGFVEDGVDMSQPLSNQRLSPPTFQAFVALKLGLLFRQDIISGMASTFGIIVDRILNCCLLLLMKSWKTEDSLLLCALSLLIVASMQPFEEVTDDALSPLLSVHGYQILASR